MSGKVHKLNHHLIWSPERLINFPERETLIITNCQPNRTFIKISYTRHLAEWTLQRFNLTDLKLDNPPWFILNWYYLQILSSFHIMIFIECCPIIFLQENATKATMFSFNENLLVQFLGFNIHYNKLMVNWIYSCSSIPEIPTCR